MVSEYTDFEVIQLLHAIYDIPDDDEIIFNTQLVDTTVKLSMAICCVARPPQIINEVKGLALHRIRSALACSEQLASTDFFKKDNCWIIAAAREHLASLTNAY